MSADLRVKSLMSSDQAGEGNWRESLNAGLKGGCQVSIKANPQSVLELGNLILLILFSECSNLLLPFSFHLLPPFTLCGLTKGSSSCWV